MNPEKKELSPSLRLLLGGGGLVLIIIGLRAVAPILNPLLLALILAVTITPLLGWLEKKGLPAWLSLLITILVIIGSGLILVTFVIFASEQLINQVPSYQAGLDTQKQAIESQLSQFGFNVSSITQSNFLKPENLVDLAGSVGGEVVRAISSGFIMLLILFFLLLGARGFTARLRPEWIPAHPILDRASRFGKDIRHYVLITTWINLLVGIANAVFLLILGVDFAILWGILAWLLGYIPSIGFWLALIPPFFLAFMEFGITKAMIVLVGYILINGSVQNLIQPRLMGRGLNLAPVMVVLSLFFWTWILGPMGALLAVPLTLAVQKMILQGDESTEWLAEMMGTGSASRYGQGDEVEG
jgi:AI-2 transport protein TqsA